MLTLPGCICLVIGGTQRDQAFITYPVDRSVINVDCGNSPFKAKATPALKLYGFLICTVYIAPVHDCMVEDTYPQHLLTEALQGAQVQLLHHDLPAVPVFLPQLPQRLLHSHRVPACQDDPGLQYEQLCRGIPAYAAAQVLKSFFYTPSCRGEGVERAGS